MTRRFLIATLAAVVTLGVVSWPATGTSPITTAKRALRISKQAKRESSEADARADKAIDRAAALENRVGAAEQNASIARALTQFATTPGDFPNGELTTVTKDTTIHGGDVAFAYVDCPAGTAFTSGGHILIGKRTRAFFEHRSGNGYAVGVDNSGQPNPVSLQVEANCAPSDKLFGANDHAAESALVQSQIHAGL